MPLCIFCSNELTETTKPEHILPNALGGRKTARRTICSDCNNVFGGSIDKCLASQIEIIRNMLQLKSGAGKAPPMLRNIQSGTQTVNFRNDGTQELSGKPFEIEKLEDGTVAVQICSRSEVEFQKTIPNLAAQLGIPIEQVVQKIEVSDIFQIVKPVDKVHHSLSFGGADALRSIAKSCLVLWATQVGNLEVTSSPYDDVRRFVVDSDEAFNLSRINLDSRSLPCDSGLREQFGDIFNLIYLKSDATGRLIGYFTMYNAISWQIVLAESGVEPDLNVGLISNPLNPAEWSDAIAAEFDIEFEWLDNPAFGDFNNVQERFRDVVTKCFELGQAREIDKIVDDVCGRHGILDDDRIPEDLRAQIITEIADRISHFALRAPYERPLSPAEIKTLLLGSEHI